MIWGIAMELLVGIGEYRVSQATGSIVTRGLGSCVGITLWDKHLKIGGLAHIMLPNSRDFSSYTNSNKFADLALPALYAEIKARAGIKGPDLVAKLAGGAKMFAFTSDRPGFDIGQRNVVMVKNLLRIMSIPVIADDTGGSWGRTMILDLASGDVRVRTVGKGEMVF